MSTNLVEVSSRRAPRALLLAATLALVSAGTGCASTHEMGAPIGSVFPKRTGETMTEEAIIRAIETPVALEAPARVLVVPADELVNDYYGRSTARRLAAIVADRLDESPVFQPTLSMPLPESVDRNDPVLPLQRLREKAARYRARYALITFSSIEHEESANPLCLLYAGLVTMLFVPGQSVGVHARLQAVLLDVPTGVIVFATSHEEAASQALATLGTRKVRAELADDAVRAGGVELAKKVERAARHMLALARAAPAR